MRILAFLFFAASMHVSANTLSQTISLSCTNLEIQKVISSIENQTGHVVFYKKDVLSYLKPVTLNVINMPLGEFMGLLLKDKPVEFHIIEGKTIILSKKAAINKAEIDDIPTIDIALFQTTVTGTVKNSAGQPLENATVKLKNSQIGVATSASGQFTLRNVPDGSVLQISMIGYQSIEIKITKSGNDYVASTVNSAQSKSLVSSPGASLNLQITMIEAASDLNEVVISTGVVNRKAESFTGASTTVRGDELRRVGNQNIFQSLKNLDPTVYVMENFTMGSDPNSMPDLNMRGGTSFNEPMPGENLKGNYQNKPNQPLFILDGFEASVERVFDLDMNLVESLTILKDASAKALYGSRAANGVVVIETKKLNATKPRLSYTGSLDLTMPDLSSYDLLNAEEKLMVEFREGVYLDNPTSMANYNNLRKQVLEGLNTYWLSKPVQMGTGQKHSLNVELGRDELRTSINLSHYDNVGVMKRSGRKTSAAAFNLLYRISKLSFQNRLSITSNKAEDSPYGPFSAYTVLNPYINPYDADGNMLVILPGSVRNPLNDGNIPTSLTSGYFDVTNNFEAEYRVFEGLRIRARLSLNKKTNTADRYYPATHSRFATGVYTSAAEAHRKGQYEANYGNGKKISGDLYLNYNTKINEDHNIFVNLGVNAAEEKFREEIHYAEGFPSVYMNDMMFAYQYNSVQMRPSGTSGFTREMGLLSMLSYTYQDRFLFDGTFRLNASSVFGNENLLAPFWSLGLGWNLHKEKFMENVAGLKLLKVRGSIGSTGNQNFLTNKSLTVNNYYLSDRYTTLIGSYAANMENPELKWEEKMDYDAGIDADFYGFNIRFDVYRSITQNMVTSISSAPSTGFVNVSDNLGKVENKGIEATVSYTVFQNINGFLRANVSYTNNKNTILEISEAMRTFNEKQMAIINNRDAIASNTKPIIMYYDGLPMNTIWAVPSYGIDPATGIELLRGKDGEPTYIWKASDMVPSGISVPKWRGNFGFNGEYKGIGLSVTFTYLGGGQLYNQTLVDKVENVGITSNFDRRVLTDRWYTPGEETQYKRNTGNTPYDMRNGLYFYSGSQWRQEPTRATQRFVQNQDELNISSVTLSYDFSRKVLQKLKMERLRVSAYMNDVAKFSTIGIERGTTYPFARTVSFKINATF